ncbi:MAG: Lrp/AsnC family transcriptional regulator [Thermoplasmatales archaeon]|nr:MAG: Lrp/AsnC family transcriptional regulator [Thermoplasmatales archaeon]
MYDLDVKDKKILFYLTQNSRQSLKSLGKKVGISKELASYRIKRMLKNKIIMNFSIIINFERLGYSLMQTHYKFININPKIKQEILDFFIKHNHTMYVSLVEGINDLQSDFYMGRPQQFEKLLDDIRGKFYSYLSFQSSYFFFRGEFYNYSFLIKDMPKKMLINWIWGQKLYCIDELDFKILKELSNNARISTKNIANKLKSTVSTINYRIKKLEQELIIGLYTINIDWSKLGYRFFHLRISLRDYSKKNQIIEHMRKNPNLIRRFKFINLDMDLHFTLLLKNMQELRTIIENLSTTFPNSINDYHFFSAYNVFKYNFMVPEILKNKDPLCRGHTF